MFDILVACLLVFYFLPMAEARDRANPNTVSIALVNIFLGWTVFGWVVAFAWARKVSPVEFYVERNSDFIVAA
jgi:T4 superinfection immunity protein